jgi:hypothetical protein
MRPTPQDAVKPLGDLDAFHPVEVEQRQRSDVHAGGE